MLDQISAYSSYYHYSGGSGGIGHVLAELEHEILKEYPAAEEALRLRLEQEERNRACIIQ